jgi:hypothetical protein
MMMLCIDQIKVSEKDSRLRVPWSLAPKYDRLSGQLQTFGCADYQAWQDASVACIAVHAFMELWPAMW